ncbi:dienelactone hydrolase family protein, partial [Streptomyces sp. NPDC005492]|uniref:dienelactone hydrolase family protein n=1 Tax=Streptomyces sp. NPDC005492 TaxID=3156883 RepID=UPI0033A9A5F7
MGGTIPPSTAVQELSTLSSELPKSTGAPARQNVTFPSAGGTAHGYLALPPSGRGPGVIVIQEWWGLTNHVADVADRLAREGFVAFAPDLFGGNVAHGGRRARFALREAAAAG